MEMPDNSRTSPATCGEDEQDPAGGYPTGNDTAPTEGRDSLARENTEDGAAIENKSIEYNTNDLVEDIEDRAATSEVLVLNLSEGIAMRRSVLTCFMFHETIMIPNSNSALAEAAEAREEHAKQEARLEAPGAQSIVEVHLARLLLGLLFRATLRRS